MIHFQPITIDSLSEIQRYFRFQNYRTCDFTIGGMFMWADYFKYEYVIYEETLFIKGVSEIDRSEIAFSIPVGKLDLTDSIGILKDYCSQNKIKFVLSAIPEDAKDKIISAFPFSFYKLDNWADYLYDAQKLASLPGKSYNKKRNHVKKFRQLYPPESRSVYKKINESNIQEVISFFQLFNSQNNKDNSIFHNEAIMTKYVLDHYTEFKKLGFDGSIMIIDGNVAGFIIGEILLETLYIHIEKADRNCEGIYETLNMKFVEDIIKHHPEIKYVNKEEDVGDEGLRKSKLSYHPTVVLNKFNLTYNGKT